MTIPLNEYQERQRHVRSGTIRRLRHVYIRIPYLIVLSFLVIIVIMTGIMFTKDNVVVMAVTLSLIVVETVILFLMLLYLLPISEMHQSLRDFLLRHPEKSVPIENFHNINVEELELYDFQSLDYRTRR